MLKAVRLGERLPSVVQDFQIPHEGTDRGGVTHIMQIA